MICRGARRAPGTRQAVSSDCFERMNSVPKKLPLRQCLGCREMKPKKELIRVVRSPEGQVSLDFKGKLPGRGAYVCPNPQCLKKAQKSRNVPGYCSGTTLLGLEGYALPPEPKQHICVSHVPL